MQESKEYKDVEIIMLECNHSSRIIKTRHNRLLFDQANFDDEHTYQELYVVFNESPQNNEFCIITNQVGTEFLTIYKDNRYWFYNENCTHIDILSGEAKRIVATTDERLNLLKISDETIEQYLEYSARLWKIKVIPEISPGWVPTYNDPDNIGLAKPAEPTGRYVPVYIDNIIEIITSHL